MFGSGLELRLGKCYNYGQYKGLQHTYYHGVGLGVKLELELDFGFDNGQGYGLDVHVCYIFMYQVDMQINVHSCICIIQDLFLRHVIELYYIVNYILRLRH